MDFFYYTKKKIAGNIVSQKFHEEQLSLIKKENKNKANKQTHKPTKPSKQRLVFEVG